ncbi:L-lysine 2,3-aminomutase (KAM) (LAM) [Treponema primitia ZAS-2]|uniref:L-lysine 2,3-aminomutase (KAM) (LAM) n=1 Tax=Treponema primitia (strain ATCC BAA-887 / DSM 12427 / ZAS-2) TaxID=545694 RepID=F5YKS6_TREPZ|nr:KamA family radical SAM protein [Treponema primitia]AEF86849.1 L-lysine 2,3-aminomutase (KAM) (LAM) [Treponema primitia ZAS-2]
MPFPLITTVDRLPPALAASAGPAERAYAGELRSRFSLPFAVTPHFASLAGPDPDDPIRRQFFPDPREAIPDSFALDDPLGAALWQASPRLVHQYRDRALLLAGGACAGYCRYCFRRVWVGGGQAFIGGAELEAALGYLREHPEIREILVSGGDPLTAGDAALGELFRRLREARPGILLRVCTRVPITEPTRLSPGLIGLFRQWRPLRLAVHINHPRELAVPAREALAACVDAGIPVHVQTVLLRGINDSVETLEELFRECLCLGLSPYYLFQLDLAPGTAHFRVPLEQGLSIYEALQARIGGPGLPAYAVDLPGGGGKIRLRREAIAGEEEREGRRVLLLEGPGGKRWVYPAE